VENHLQDAKWQIDFYIPLEVPSQNKTNVQHWAVRVKFKKLCVQWIRHASRGAGKATGARRLKLTAYRKRRITDDANLRGGAKDMVDSIVNSGLLVDDNDKMAQIEYRQELAGDSPTGKPCTRIQIEDIQCR
jgi:hypothetical protein